MSVMEETRPTTAPTGSMNVMDSSGHSKVTWNKDTPAEVDIARGPRVPVVTDGQAADYDGGDAQFVAKGFQLIEEPSLLVFRVKRIRPSSLQVEHALQRQIQARALHRRRS